MHTYVSLMYVYIHTYIYIYVLCVHTNIRVCVYSIYACIKGFIAFMDLGVRNRRASASWTNPNENVSWHNNSSVANTDNNGTRGNIPSIENRLAMDSKNGSDHNGGSH